MKEPDTMKMTDGTGNNVQFEAFVMLGEDSIEQGCQESS